MGRFSILMHGFDLHFHLAAAVSSFHEVFWGMDWFFYLTKGVGSAKQIGGLLLAVRKERSLSSMREPFSKRLDTFMARTSMRIPYPFAFPILSVYATVFAQSLFPVSFFLLLPGLDMMHAIWRSFETIICFLFPLPLLRLCVSIDV